MNERIKEIAKQAGFNDFPDDKNGVWITDGYWDEQLETFAALIRQDEAQACAKHYVDIMRDAVEQAVAKEREACAKLCEEMGAMEALDGETETSAVMVRVADKQSRLCAAAIRARDMYTKQENIDTSEECVHETDKSIHEDDDIQEYKRPWVSLTDEEMENLVGFMRGNTMIDFARAIEDKLRERNT
jgi:hypothetical protein